MYMILLSFLTLLNVVQSIPISISILPSNDHKMEQRDRFCLSLCCTVGYENANVTVETTSSSPEECFSNTCSDVCNRVCCVNTNTKVIPLLTSNILLDTETCLKYTCELIGDEVELKQTDVDCVKCSSSFINIPGHCCPRCLGVADELKPGEWGEWSPCSTTCGKGLQSSVRTCYEGDATPHCPIPTLRMQDCNVEPCPIACQWEWSEYSECSVSCGGGGVRTRHPIITQKPEFGGKPCPVDVERNKTDTLPCSYSPCLASCKWEWSTMSECTVTCGGGRQYRYPILTQEPAIGGMPCPSFIIQNKTERYLCNLQPCPVNCQWKWSRYSDCKTHCVDGHNYGRERFPIITQQSLYGGDLCPDMVYNNQSDKIKCRDEDCSNNCGKDKSLCNGVCMHDFDQDCIPDDKDNCMYDPNEDQKDQDGDGVGDECDNCPELFNTNQLDTDMDGVGNDCDNCPFVYNPDQEDGDLDSWGDVCDRCVFITDDQMDQDGDGVGDVCDNCPHDKNPDQEDRDHNSVGYYCEPDKDADGIDTHKDNCPLLYNPSQTDIDEDGVGDACDTVS